MRRKGPYERPSREPEPSVLRRRGHHASLALRAGGGDTGGYGEPQIVDETLEALDLEQVQAGDVVGIGIHTGNALRGYEIGQAAGARGAKVVFGGIHATLYPDEAHELGGAHAVVRGDGDVIWPLVLETRRAARCSGPTRADGSTPSASCRRGGICCRKAGTCGDRCRRSAGVPSIVRSARCGEPTARSRASARIDSVVDEIVAPAA